MKRNLFVLIFVSALWGNAQDSSPESKFYLGVKVGLAKIEDSDNCSSCNDYGFGLFQSDSYSHAFGAFGGYRINRYWSAELSHFNVNKANFHSAKYDENFEPETFHHFDTEFRSLAGAIKGFLPVSCWFSFQAKAGWHFYRAKFQEEQFNRQYQQTASSSLTLKDNDYFLGAGFVFRLNRRMNLGFEAELWNAGSLELSQTALKDSTFDFTTVNYSVTFTYKF